MTLSKSLNTCAFFCYQEISNLKSYSDNLQTFKPIYFIASSFEELRNRILVHPIETTGSCTHEVACPPGHGYTPLLPGRAEPAKTYTFTLDAFQTESILCIENNQSVLVSAHTSAGKTVVAE